MARKLADPIPFAAGVLLVIASFLALDSQASAHEQLLLGAATWAILILSCRSLGTEDRSRVVLVVIVATCAEVLGSIVIGAYTYRLDNLPAFVPPGHGLVYLGGLRISQSGTVQRHARGFAIAAATAVGAWGAAGLLLLGRPDLLGAIAGLLLIYMLIRGRAPTLYAGVFADRCLPRAIRDSDRGLALVRCGTRHAAQRRQPAQRHRKHLRAVRHRGDHAGAPAARANRARARGCSAPPSPARRPHRR